MSTPVSETAAPIERRVDLPYSDWLFATWRPRETLPPLPPRPKLPAKLDQQVAALLTPDRLPALLDGRADISPSLPYWRYDLIGVTQHCVLPYLSDAQREECRAALRRGLAGATYFDKKGFDLANYRFGVAALLGMPGEVAPAVDEADAHTGYGQYYLRFFDAARLFFGLGSAAEVTAAFNRTGLRLSAPHHVRGWLAHTLWHELGHVTASILALTTKADCESLTRALGRCLAPETAPEMLRLAVESKATAVARDWLHEHPELAVAGLAPIARGQSNLTKAAADFLRELRRKGHAAAVEQAVSAHPEVRATVFEDDAVKLAELAPAEMPEELRDALATPGKPLGWVDVAGLPPIVVGGRRLGEKAVTALLNAIKNLKEASLPAAVVAVRRHAEPRSLDAFAWALFEAWQREGMPSKEKWAFAAVGHLGGDASALKLTPLIREWPGQSKHQTAVLGLKVLCGIGTDTALMSLNGIAQKVKFAGVKKAARETMEQIASARGLSRVELEDRIVPDLGLDARGGRDLDFGPRKFRVLLDGQLNPVVREADGKPRGDLPKPNAKDDPAKAEAAVAEWKLLKKQLKEVVKSQAPRLEQAMVTMRRWPVADFHTLVVGHPLMTNFARRLVWGGFDAAGRLLRTFRVTEELETTGADDKPVTLDGVERVGVVHPMQLSAAERNAWGQLLGDYEIVPPFAQLARPVVTLDAAEGDATEVTRFAKLKIDPQIVWYGLPKMGWEHGPAADGGHVDYFSKHFPGAAITAQVRIDPGVSMGGIDFADKQALAAVRFVAGEPRRAWYFSDTKDALPLGRVNQVVVSEVLSELARLAAKGE